MAIRQKKVADAIEITWNKYGYGVRAFKDDQPITKKRLFDTEKEAIVYANNNFVTKDDPDERN